MGQYEDVTVARHYPGKLEVRPCPCWPGHFDPKGICFPNEEPS